jgi:hypothetical protein
VREREQCANKAGSSAGKAVPNDRSSPGSEAVSERRLRATSRQFERITERVEQRRHTGQASMPSSRTPCPSHSCVSTSPLPCRASLTFSAHAPRCCCPASRRRNCACPSRGSWREGDSSIPVPTQSALRTLEWVGRAENLALSGPSGTGKSHFVEALAHAVIDAGMRVSWFSLESLTATIGRAKVDASVSKVVARICRSELIVVDDIGMLPAGQDAAEAFYRVVDAAYERRSVAVTSNLHPSKAHRFGSTCARSRLKLTGSGDRRPGCGRRSER